MSISTSAFTHGDYMIGWISALPTELAAAEYMLDKIHTERLEQDPQDTNVYVRGEISGHNVVIACLPSAGSNSAAIAAIQIRRTYPNIKFGLMVGIGGGVPQVDHDIRLGDIVVSLPGKDHTGVVQIDYGTRIHQGVDGFKRTGILNKPPRQLVNAVQTLIAKHKVEEPKYNDYLSVSAMRAKAPRMVKTFVYQGDDVLFKFTYKHQSPDAQSCDSCDRRYLIMRRPRVNFEDEPDHNPVVWYGNIASSNHVMRDATTRDIIAKQEKVICFEMEAAGLMDDFPCIMIRGICDYADSHKTKRWQDYAALVAAAYTKELLLYIPQDDRLNHTVQSRNVHWIMPRSSNVLFTGRRAVLDRLSRALRDRPNEVQVTQRRFVLVGMGGSGKSEVSIKFAEENQERFWGIFWIDAVSETTAQRSFANIAKACNLSEDSEDIVKQWLSNLKVPWLLIIDNANDLKFDYARYIPSGNRGNILLTSRIIDCEALATVGYEHFEKLDEEEAVVLLRKAMGPSAHANSQKSTAIKSVVDLLGLHALAIIQAGAFIKRGLCTIDQYPTLFSHQRKQLLNYSPRQAQSLYGDVYATFEVSVKALQASKDQESIDALELLDLLSFFHRDGVEEFLFKGAWDLGRKIHLEFQNSSNEKEKSAKKVKGNNDIQLVTDWHVFHLPKLLGDIDEEDLDILRFRQARNILAALSLIRVDYVSGSISMHALAHSWANDRLTASKRKASFFVLSSTLALAVGGDFSTHGRLDSRFRSHLESCLPHISIKQFLAETGFPGCQTIFRFAMVLNGTNADYDYALMLANELCDYLGVTMSSTMPVSHIRCYYIVLASKYRLGQLENAAILTQELLNVADPVDTELYFRILNFTLFVAVTSKATQYLKDVAAMLKKRIAVTNEEQRKQVLNLALGGLNLESGELDQAIELNKEVLMKGGFETKNIVRVLAQAHLWECYMVSNRPGDAAEFVKSVIESQEMILDPLDYQLSTSHHRLAQSYMAMGKHEEALEILEKVVATRLATNVTESDREDAQRDLEKCHAAVLTMKESEEISESWEDLSLS